jgi:protein-tyrosine phosphatase
MKILFVCLGNICRSSTAEEVFRTLTHRRGISRQFEVDSAGTSSYHEGELPDARMRSAARQFGYELTHRSRPVRESDFSHFDLLIAMDESVERSLLRLASTEEAKLKVRRMADYLSVPRPQRDIPDPYYGGAEGFRNVVALLEDACCHLLEVIAPEEYIKS